MYSEANSTEFEMTVRVHLFSFSPQHVSQNTKFFPYFLIKHEEFRYLVVCFMGNESSWTISLSSFSIFNAQIKWI